jgi:hypothetical protein
MCTRHEHQPSDLDSIPPPEERTVEVPQEQDGWDHEDQVSKPSDQTERDIQLEGNSNVIR